jgi:hypothetical protein
VLYSSIDLCAHSLLAIPPSQDKLSELDTKSNNIERADSYVQSVDMARKSIEL